MAELPESARRRLERVPDPDMRRQLGELWHTTQAYERKLRARDAGALRLEAQYDTARAKRRDRELDERMMRYACAGRYGTEAKAAAQEFARERQALDERDYLELRGILSRTRSDV